MSSTPSGFNIDEVIKHLTAQAGPSAGGLSPRCFSGLDSALDLAAARAKAVGDLPPRPATSRAAVGFLLVRIVRRMLFWFIPGIRGFHESVSASLAQVRACLGLLEDENANRIEAIQWQVRASLGQLEEENAAIQRQIAERLDRVEGEVSRLSVRADVLVKLQRAMEQHIDEPGRPDGAGRQEVPVPVVEWQGQPAARPIHGSQPEEQATEALEKRADDQEIS